VTATSVNFHNFPSAHSCGYFDKFKEDNGVFPIHYANTLFFDDDYDDDYDDDNERMSFIVA